MKSANLRVTKQTEAEVVMIPQHVLYHKWIAELEALWPTERRSRLKAMTWFLVCLFQSGQIYLSKMARKLPGKAQQSSKTHRLMRLLHNRRYFVRRLYHPIATQLLASAAASGGPIRLLIDGSKVGNGHQLLMVALAYRRRAIPIMWTWRKGKRGHSPAYAQVALFLAVKRLLPPEVDVVVCGDSEFGTAKLMRCFSAWGWFYVLRQKGSHQLSFDNGKTWQRCEKLVTRAGQRVWAADVLLTQKHHTNCHFLALWQRGCDKPWLLATNLPDARQARLFYSRRMWIEALFGDCKGSGFDIESTRLQKRYALNRLVLFVSLLVVWLLAFGSAIVKNGQRSLVDRSYRRELSLFRIGWDSIERRLANEASFNIRLQPYF